MNWKIAGIVSIMAALFVVMASGVVLHMPNEQHINEKDASLNKEIEVLVFGSDDSAEEVFDLISSKGAVATMSNDGEVSNDVDAVIITESWFKSNADAAKTITSMVNEEMPVSIYKYDFEWEMTGLTISYSDEAMINSVCNIGNKVKCFAVKTDDYQAALDRTVEWIIDVLGEKSKMSGIDTKGLETEVESFCDYQSSGYGWTYVRTTYYELECSNPDYNYYVGHYSTSMVPDSGSYNSGLDISSTLSSGTMLRYGPHTTTDASDASVNIWIGSSDVSFTVGSSWSYSVHNAIILDYTNMGINKLDSRHNVDESKTTNYTMFDAEPGKLVKIPSNDNYAGIDTYKTQFCHKGGLFNDYRQYNDVTVSLNVVIQA